VTGAAKRDWQTYAGVSVVALAAAVMSFASWADLAALVGITQHAGRAYLCWLMPVAVDAYAFPTARVWLQSTTASDRTRTYARRTSIGAIAMSVSGNALYHLIVAVKFDRSPWWPVVVVIVSGLPALQLGLALHLMQLMSGDRTRQMSGHVTGHVTGHDADTDTPDVRTRPKRVRTDVPDTAPAVTGHPPDMSADSVRTSAARIAELLSKCPDMTRVSVATELGVSERTVRRNWPDTIPVSGHINGKVLT